RAQHMPPVARNPLLLAGWGDADGRRRRGAAAARELLREAGARPALPRNRACCRIPVEDGELADPANVEVRGAPAPGRAVEAPRIGDARRGSEALREGKRARGRVSVENGELAARGEVDAPSIRADVEVVRTAVGDERRAVAAGSAGRVAAFYSLSGRERTAGADMEGPQAGVAVPNAPEGGVEMASAWAELDIRSLETGRQRDARSGRRGRVAALQVRIAVRRAGCSGDNGKSG